MKRGRLAAVLPPIVFGILFLAAWELFVVARDIKPYLLPKPSAIWGQFHGNFTFIRKATQVTGTNALIGLLLGVVLGSAIAFAASRFKLLNELISPMAIAVSAMPIIVLVAIFNDLFVITSEIPRRLMVAVVVFFLVFINVSKGLTQADATQLELMRSYGAGEADIIRKVRVPHALEFFFVALRQAAPLAVVTAFVSEYFGGLQNGLGSRISQSIANSRDAAGWAYVVGACLLGLAFFLLSIALERIAMPWKVRRSSS
ncbi:MAG: ABC transporter permease subunit [Acidimicrobiales bacterium]